MTVYVYGGHLPNGGAINAFEAAHVLSRGSGDDLVVVTPEGQLPGKCDWFSYPVDAPEISLSDLKQTGRPADVLFLNPSFHHELAGLWFPGRIVTYVQHFTTFAFLDPACRGFVCGSSHIAAHIKALYGIEAEIIHPFAELDTLPAPLAWDEKQDRFLISVKGHPRASIALLDHVYACGFSPDRMASLLPGPRSQVLDEINRHKWFLTFALTEGFGLMPVEAMAMGSVVAGFDGFGGADFLVDGHNAFILPFDRMRELPSFLEAVYERRDDCELLRTAAAQTVWRFTRARFRDDWSAWFARHF